MASHSSPVRLLACNISVHSRCQPNVHVICSPQNSSRRDDAPAAGPLRKSIFLLYLTQIHRTPEPVIFGRELTEQVRADSRIGDRMVPLIVEKCIAAVDGTGKSPPSQMGEPITDSSV
jgi:hypothetical protein